VASKIGPQRTTKNAQKLKLLPNPDPGDDQDEESGREVYSQFTRIKDPSARRDAARLGKADRERLPRVTAYCTASAYRMDNLMRFLKGRSKSRGANPKRFDECIYSPYHYGTLTPDRTTDEDMVGVERSHGGDTAPSSRSFDRRESDSAILVDETTISRREELVDMNDAANDDALITDELPERGSLNTLREATGALLDGSKLDTSVHTPEIFLFDYGTVVIWGMTLLQERRFLKDIARFESEKLAEDDVQTENFNFYYTREYQARIYNDFISLREKRNYMTKLAISHALAQSVKVVSLVTSDAIPN